MAQAGRLYEARFVRTLSGKVVDIATTGRSRCVFTGRAFVTRKTWRDAGGDEWYKVGRTFRRLIVPVAECGNEYWELASDDYPDDVAREI